MHPSSVTGVAHRGRWATMKDNDDSGDARNEECRSVSAAQAHKPKGATVKRTAVACLMLATLLMCAAPTRADDWPQWLGPKRDGIWRETGLLDKFPEKGPKLRWRAELAHGYSGPAVSQGKVYITDFLPSEG